MGIRHLAGDDHRFRQGAVMSKLAQALRHHNTGQRFLRLEPFRFTEIKDEHRELSTIYMNEDREYLIEARFVTKFKYRADEQPPSEVVRRSKQMITEEIFGEYRQPLYLAAYLLDNREYEKAQRIILDVLTNFYEPEPMGRVSAAR